MNQLKEHVNVASAKVLFMGWVSGEEKNSILHSASLLALPSFQENFGICVTEALACGVPVMLSRHVNLASQTEEAGAGWVTGVSAAEIQHTLTEALGNADELKRRGEAGRSFVSAQFGRQKVSEQLVALYRDIATPASDAVTLTPSFAEK